MLRTEICDLLGISSPVIQGALGGPWRASAQLIAAVSNAGGLGSVAASLRGSDDVHADIAEVRALTAKPFAVNHTRRPFNEEAFQATLDERPPVVSLALGEPSDLVARVHDVGSLFIQQVQTVQQGLQAAEAGVDVIIAQGGEGGGFSGMVGTIALVPQVVRAVSPIPVVAAGGIADGRGLAAALVLGAQGVNIGTRFLASTEAGISEEWKQAICSAESEDAVKIEFADHVVPALTEGGWDAIPALPSNPIHRCLERPQGGGIETGRKFAGRTDGGNGTGSGARAHSSDWAERRADRRGPSRRRDR